MKRFEELAVITKTYDLILWTCNHTSKFPRNHRFVLGERIERRLYTLLETLIAAKFARDKHKQALLERANVDLEVLRFQMRLDQTGTPSLAFRSLLLTTPRSGVPTCQHCYQTHPASGRHAGGGAWLGAPIHATR